MLPGWAFSYVPDSPLPKKELAGRSARICVTMDSPNFWYWLVNRGSAHRAFRKGTLDFCGFGPINETTLYKVRDMSKETRHQWLEKMAVLGGKDARKFGQAPAELPA